MKRRYILQHAIILIFSSSPLELFNYKQISKRIGIVNPVQKLQVVEILYDLADANYILEVNCGRYRYNNKGSILSGRFVGRSNSYNSFLPDDKTSPIKVSHENSMHALDGDLVRVKLLTKRTGPSPEAEVIEILQRIEHRLTGKLQVTQTGAFLITENKTLSNNVFIPGEKLNGGKDGDKVCVRITSWADDEKNPSGEVIDVLGIAGQNQAEMKALLTDYGIPYQYPARVENAAKRISETIPSCEISKRKDFRSVRTFTIDPKDAKDFDDAISARRLDNGNWEVGVHIADVTYYVKPGTIIDREAEDRAMSVYLADQTVPMLPERLCNQICSLRPDEDKLCFSVIFELDETVRVCQSQFCHTVIRSDCRFFYEEVQQIIETGEGECKDEIAVLNRMANTLHEQRFSNGAVCLNRNEAKFEMNKEDGTLQIRLKERNDAHKLVEEFMLLANRTVAEAVSNMSEGNRKKTFIYRVHQPPGKEKLEKLCCLIHNLVPDIELDKKELFGNINLLSSSIKDGAVRSAIEAMLIHIMNKAKYSIDNIGHYGLAFDHYTHFTSPIRRYPDILVHRLLNHYLSGGNTVKRKQYELACSHCTEMEILVSRVERASIRMMQVEYMKGKEGQLFSGFIWNVAEWGVYVELDENRCEGLVPVRSLGNEYFDWNEKKVSLTGRITKRCFRFGDHVIVRLEQINPEQREMYFSICPKTE